MIVTHEAKKEGPIVGNIYTQFTGTSIRCANFAEGLFQKNTKRDTVKTRKEKQWLATW